VRRIIMCFCCGKPTGLYRSYGASVEKWVEVMGQVMKCPKIKVRVCGKCAEAAGYKVGPRAPLTDEQREAKRAKRAAKQSPSDGGTLPMGGPSE